MTRAHLRDLNVMGWLACGAIILIAVNQAHQSPRPVDFTYFYSVGHILNQYAPDHLYDAGLQQSTFNHVWPLKEGEGIYGPSPYPPFVAMMFRPLALLSFWTSFRVWMFLSASLYITGLLLLVRRFVPADPWRQSALVCLGLIYWPLLTRTLLNGQLSSVGFLAIACAICLEDAGLPFLSGAALAICSYKPTLLLLIIPMLAVTGRKKALVGFAAVAAMIIAVTTAVEGMAIWPGYFRLSAQFAAQRALIVIVRDYADFVAASTALSHGTRWISGLILACGCVPAAFLLRIWYLSTRNSTRLPATLIWGTTLTWTLILNVYVPLYDTILIIASMIITAKALKKSNSSSFILVVAGIVVSSYVTQIVAAAAGLQLLTVFLGALGIMQMRACFAAMNARPRPTSAGAGLLGQRAASATELALVGPADAHA